MVEVRRERNKAAERLLQQALGIDGFETKVGWFENAKEENGTPTAEVAAVQEFGRIKPGQYGGTIVIPPRLGFRETAAKRQKSWRAYLAGAADLVIQGRMSGEEAMEGLGLKARGDLVRRIASNPQPPLAERTLAARRRKGRNHTETLVDSGRMIESLESKTEKV